MAWGQRRSNLLTCICWQLGKVTRVSKENGFYSITIFFTLPIFSIFFVPYVKSSTEDDYATSKKDGKISRRHSLARKRRLLSLFMSLIFTSFILFLLPVKRARYHLRGWQQIQGEKQEQQLSSADTSFAPTEILELANALYDKQYFSSAAKFYINSSAILEPSWKKEREFSILRLVQCHIAEGDVEEARKWTDIAMKEPFRRAEPAYYMCKALREKEEYALAYYYYLLAADITKPSREDFLEVEEPVYEYRLDFEKSIIWSYVGAWSDRSTLRHGLSLCMKLLENPSLPNNLASVVYNNIPVYTQQLRGDLVMLRSEKSNEDAWRFSTPTFLQNHTLIREVNYYALLDGSYHVSNATHVNTKLLVDGINRYITVEESEKFHLQVQKENWHHSDAYILGLEDTRVVADQRTATVYTLSGSMEYTRARNTMNQVLGVLDTETWRLSLQGIMKGPRQDRSDKNWVFAGGLDQVVYEWFPSIQVGHIDLENSELIIDRAIQSPKSFIEMRGSTNGIFYNDQWWFVTHTVKHRHEKIRIYTHRLVVLDKNLTTIARYSLPFTFQAHSDIEYCLGLKVENSGFTFGHSVRDHSTWTLKVGWGEVEQLFV